MNAEDLKGAISRLIRTRPLIHHITNVVVAHITANLTLALGALPIMAHAPEEAEEIVSKASVLLLNLGTPTKEQLKAMELSGTRAKERGIPIILDPVGVGASGFRTEAAWGLIHKLKPSVIRSNLGEALAMLQEGGGVKGVESLVDNEELALKTAKNLAERLGCVSAITGKTDVVSDGKVFRTIQGGSPWLKHITGSGCMATASIACFLATEPPLEASILGLSLMKRASELAGNSKGPGSFGINLIDAVHRLRSEP